MLKQQINNICEYIIPSDINIQTMHTKNNTIAAATSQLGLMFVL